MFPNVAWTHSTLSLLYVDVGLMLHGECTKHMYYFGVTCCVSNVSCVINYEVLRQWRQEC
jgi:hypothetical protein